MIQQQQQRSNRTVTGTIAAIGLFSAIAPLARAQTAMPDRVSVRVEVAGRAFAGELAVADPVETPPTASQPTTAAAEDATPTVTIAGGDAPYAVHLDAGDSLDTTQLHDTRVHWDFGDSTPTSRFNALDGYNAAHVYDAPGTYAITRVTETPSGQSAVRVMLEVKPANRSIVYVSADGDDRNDGATADRAIRSWGKAAASIGSNLEIRFRRGDTFAFDRAITVRTDNVRLCSYGEASRPRPTLIIERPLSLTFAVECVGRRLLVEDLAFDATYFGNDMGKANLPEVFHPTGSGGLVLRRCEFRNVNAVVNGNGQPRGVLLMDNDLPLETGLRSYFAWVEGSDWTLLGNHVANSTREHIVRVGGNGATRVNLQFNDFNNLDRTQATTRPDAGDNAKAALNIQKGSVVYVAHNWLRGANGIGPLGKADGLADKAGRWVGAVIEHNRIDGFYEVNHGASFITLRDNLIRADNAIAFPIGGFDQTYGRGVSDVWIEHNTVIDAAPTGNFLAIQAGAARVQLLGNLYVAPNLVTGANQAAAVYTNEPDLRAFARIAGNVWPVGKPNGWAQNGVHYVAAAWGDRAGYRDATEWAAMRPPVEDDRFENVTNLTGLQSSSDGAGIRDVSQLPAARP